MNQSTVQAVRWGLPAVVLLAAGVLAAVFHEQWLPAAEHFWPPGGTSAAVSAGPHDGDDAAQDHEHDHPGHAESTSIEISPQARQKIEVEQVRLRSFERKITIPAMVVERQGRSQLAVTAPMTGIVTKIYVIEGEAVEAGRPLFDLRLTHEDLVASQRDFLRTAEELDVEQREIQRLQDVGEGVIAGRRLLERQYEKQKLEAAFRAQRQGLLLHGLSSEQVDKILKTRELVQTLTVAAPPHPEHEGHEGEEHPFHVQRILVKLGEQIETGHPLMMLGDHYELYIEGKAFEQDAVHLERAANNDWQVSAVLLGDGQRREITQGLEILFLADQVEPDTRAFHFYIAVDNAIIRDEIKAGHRFIGWKFKPGQRMEVLVPVERWEDRIVLPVDAVVDEGIESYVFIQNGDHFDRVPVHVGYRGQRHVVIANDGSLYPGDVVATSGAFQMHLAIKNKAGGGVDPHGHDH